jgi:hypothetical protein
LFSIVVDFEETRIKSRRAGASYQVLNSTKDRHRDASSKRRLGRGKSTESD